MIPTAFLISELYAANLPQIPSDYIKINAHEKRGTATHPFQLGAKAGNQCLHAWERTQDANLLFNRGRVPPFSKTALYASRHTCVKHVKLLVFNWLCSLISSSKHKQTVPDGC